MKKTIIGIGGGGFLTEQNPVLDLYILSASNKTTPRICFLPTASADNTTVINYFYNIFEKYNCDPTHLNLFNPTIRDIEDYLLNCDIIYVGGGNTKSMLAIWREWGIDTILRKAYHKNIILAGVSAGCVCWFENCISDSTPGKYMPLSCLGFLNGSSCVHYNSSIERPEVYWHSVAKGVLPDGYGIDDGVALHFEDGAMIRAVSSSEDVYAYKINLNKLNSENVVEQIEPILLNNKDNFHQYIKPSVYNKNYILPVKNEYTLDMLKTQGLEFWQGIQNADQIEGELEEESNNEIDVEVDDESDEIDDLYTDVKENFKNNINYNNILIEEIDEIEEEIKV